MKQLLSFLTLLLLSTPALFSQSDFRNGYIIKSNNDTINGWIDYRGNIANSKKCVFRITKSSDNQIFNASDLKGYRFTDSKYYVAKEITISDVKKQVFLEFLINGIVDIYYYHDELGKHYFAATEDGVFSELKNEEKEVLIANKKYTRESKEYIGFLKVIFKESPTIAKQVDNVRLNHKSLITIAHDYHVNVCDVNNKCIIYERKISKVKSMHGFLVGMNAFSASDTDQFDKATYYAESTEFGTGISPSVGYFFKTNIPYLSEKLFVQYEGTVTQMKLKSNVSSIGDIYGWEYTQDIAFTRNIFGNNLSLRYEFPQGRIRPTFQIGASANYAFKTDYYRKFEVIDTSGNLQSSDEFSEDPFRKLTTAVHFGAGIVFTAFNDKELFIEINYHIGSGLFPKLDGLHTNTYSLHVGYPIGK